MATKPKQIHNAKNELMHFSVGAVIEVNGRYLLIDRDIEPLGFAGLAGHINERETPEQALLRKVGEESSLKVEKYSLLFEEEIEWNRCRAGAPSHYWYVYRCEVTGKVRNNTEASRSIGWYAPDEVRKLNLEPVWKYWFGKILS